MKKIVSILIMALVLLAVSVPEITVEAAGGYLSGPGTVRAGDTITLTFGVSGSNLYGVSGSLAYDSNQLQYVSSSQAIGGSWVVEFNGNNFVAYDNALSSPINGSANLFTVTFVVKQVSPGNTVSVSCTGITGTDGNADIGMGSAGYSVVVAAPLSSDNSLASLSVSNASISPAFNTNTASYSAKVKYEVSRLNVSATSNDGKASVSVNSPTLTPGGYTNVTITVTAENGSAKTYTIKVYREQDPNYVPSGNNDVADIVIDGFLISPPFSTENQAYVVWLPYEVDSLSISAVATDKIAKVNVEGTENFLAGQDNIVKVVCTAENGEKKEYIIVAKRAAAHDGSADELVTTETTEEIATPDTATITDATPSDVATASDADTDIGSRGVKTVVVVIIAVLCLIVGWVLGRIKWRK